MKDDPVRNPFCIQHIEYVGVGVAIMDHHRSIMVSGDREMSGEGVPLDGLIINFPGTEVIQPGLADRPYVIIGCQPLDLGQGPIKIITTMIMSEPGGVVGVDRDTGDHTRPGPGGLHRPARALDVTADLDDPIDADLRGQLDRLGRRQVGTAVGDVQVAVGVDDRSRQRFRQRWAFEVAPLTLFGGRCPTLPGLQLGVSLGPWFAQPVI